MPDSPHARLRQAVTREQLREDVGPALFDEGEALQERGGVEWWPMDGRVMGRVREGRGRVLPVSAWVDAESGLPLYECACPLYLAEGVCTHGVALVLAVLAIGRDDRADGGDAPAPAGPRADSPRPRPPSRPETPEALHAWLEEHQLSRARTVPLAVVEPLLPRTFGRHLLYYFGSESVTAPLEGPLATRHLGARDRAAVAEASWQWLLAEAERVRRGLAREASAPPRPPPSDSRLVPVVEALLRARERVRALVPPRLLEAPGSVSLLERPVRLAVVDPELSAWARGFGVQGFGEASRLVVVEPRALLEGRSGISCPCGSQGLEASCVHALSALDTVLDLLTSDAGAALSSRLAELLFVVPGREILAALEKSSLAARAQESQAPSLHVTFRLESSSPQALLLLRPYLHRPLKKGGLSKGSVAGSHDREAVRAALGTPGEQEAFALIEAGARMVSDFYNGTAQSYVLFLQALRALAHSPRLRLAGRLDVPLCVREAPLGLAFEEVDGALLLRPSVDGAPVDVDSLRAPAEPASPQPWLILEPDVPRVTLVSVSPAARTVIDALKLHGSRLPDSLRGALLGTLSGLEASFPVSLPESLEARSVAPTPGLLVRLRPMGDSGLEGALLVRPLPEAPPRSPGEGAPVARGLRGGQRVMVRRDLDAERAEADALLERLALSGGAYRFSREDVEGSLALLEALEPLSGPSLRVEWEEQAWTVVRSPDASGLRVTVEREQDWFGVKGGVMLDGERVELAVLLEALRRRQRFVPLGPGRWMRLTDSLRERLTPLADVAQSSRQGVEVSAAAAPVLDALAEAGARVQAPPDWRALAARIRKAQTLEVPVPKGLKAELRDYQREGFVWLARLTSWGAGACLADDMGLGKTLQALALLLHRSKAGPALVVAPTSVCGNWAREAARFAPSLRVHVWHEADRSALPESLGPRDVIVVSYGLLVRDVARLSSVSFATLVVDEAQAVKNADTARARALRALRSEARVALTGTPVENRLSELWSLFHFLFPGLLGGRESFRSRFALPIERDRDPEARSALARVVRPFLLRRTKAQVARELPARIETVVPVSLSEGERRLYDDVRLAALARMEEGTVGQDRRFELLAALTRLRLAACHPRLVDSDSGVPSSKLERFLERVEELRSEGSRALVFSQFVRHLALVREALEARGVPLLYLDGSTPASERMALVDAFQRGEGALFLISLKAGGTGLNLTGADHVIHLDPWWNPAVEDQATDRAHRLGQTRPVTVSRFVSEGTIEEAILALHAEKRDLADSLLSEAEGGAALSPAQLLGLLRFGAG